MAELIYQEIDDSGETIRLILIDNRFWVDNNDMWIHTITVKDNG